MTELETMAYIGDHMGFLIRPLWYKLTLQLQVELDSCSLAQLWQAVESKMNRRSRASCDLKEGR